MALYKFDYYFIIIMCTYHRQANCASHLNLRRLLILELQGQKLVWHRHVGFLAPILRLWVSPYLPIMQRRSRFIFVSYGQWAWTGRRTRTTRTRTRHLL